MSRFLGRAVLLVLSPLFAACAVIGIVWAFSIVGFFAGVLIPFVLWGEHGMPLSWILPFLGCHLIGFVCMVITESLEGTFEDNFQNWLYGVGFSFWIILLVVLYHMGNPFVVHILWQQRG